MVGQGLANMIGNAITGGGPAVGGGGGGAFTNEWSAQFDGVTQYAATAAMTTFNGLQNASWSFWIKFDNVALGWQAPIIMWGNTSTASNRQFSFQFFNNQRCDFGLNGNVAIRDSGNFTIVAGTWYHFVGTYDGTIGTANQRPKLYKDGIQLTSGLNFNPASVLNTTSGTPFEMGRKWNPAGAGSYQRFFDGQIDEVSMFTKTLSATEVSDIYNGGTPTDLTGTADLVHYYRNGDNNCTSAPCTGTLITDEAGSLDSTLYNGASFIQDAP